MFGFAWAREEGKKSGRRPRERGEKE